MASRQLHHSRKTICMYIENRKQLPTELHLTVVFRVFLIRATHASVICAVVAWMSGCLSVCHIQCIVSKRLNLSYNFLDHLVAPSFWFLTLCVANQFQGQPLPRDVKYTGWKKTAIFESRLSRKRYEIGSWLLWKVNRKSYVADQSVSVPMTLSDP